MANSIRILRPATLVMMLASILVLGFGLYSMQQETKQRPKIVERHSAPAGHSAQHQPAPETHGAPPVPGAGQQTAAPLSMSTITSLCGLLMSAGTFWMAIGDYRMRRSDFLERQSSGAQKAG